MDMDGGKMRQVLIFFLLTFYCVPDQRHVMDGDSVWTIPHGPVKVQCKQRFILFPLRPRVCDILANLLFPWHTHTHTPHTRHVPGIDMMAKGSRLVINKVSYEG